MKAKTIMGRTVDSLRNALMDSMADGFHPTLAFVFCSVMHSRDAIAAAFDSFGIQVFGATTGGEIVDSEAMSQAISALLLDPDPASFRMAYGSYNPANEGAEAEALTRALLPLYKHPALLLVSSFRGMGTLHLGEKIQQAVTRVAGDSAEVWGGGAGDDFKMEESFVFTHNWESTAGILLLAFDTERVAVKGYAYTGMQPAGTLKTITRAEGSAIVEVDGEPAIDIIPRFVGVTVREEDFREAAPREIFLGLYRERGNPVIRSVAAFDAARKAIIVTGEIAEGDRFRLMMPPDFAVLEEVHQEALRFKATEMPEADALLMFSCIGRLGNFGPMIGDELSAIQSAYNVPLAGFFSYGEFGRTTGGNNEFHNMTCCWVAIKEK